SLSHAWWQWAAMGRPTLKEVEAPARAAARKALELDDRLADAHVAQGYLQCLYDWDWKGCENSIRRAIDLDANNLDAHFIYARLLMALGRLPEAIREIQTAVQLDPISPAVQSSFGEMLYRAGKMEEAILRLNLAKEL